MRLPSWLGAYLMTVLLGTIWPTQVLGQINVTGQGAVGVGTMSGGTINIVLPQQEAKALAMAKGPQLLKQLEAIANRISARIGAEPVHADVVYSFLAIVKGKHVPLAEWPATFDELTERFRRAGAQMAAIPVTSEQVRGLVSQADVARKAGRFEDAERLLEKADDMALQDALKLQGQARDSTRRAASVRATRASLAFARLERVQGVRLLEEAFELRRQDMDSEVLAWLIDAGDALVVAGDTRRALNAFLTAREAVEPLAAVDPDNTRWQLARSLILDRIGKQQAARGDRVAALASHTASLAIVQKLAAADPVSIKFMDDMSVSLIAIGDLQLAQRDKAAALTSYLSALTMRQKVAAAAPENIRSLRGLGISHYKVAEQQAALGDRAAALNSFTKSAEISLKLATADAEDPVLLRDRAVLLSDIGAGQAVLGDPAAAFANFVASYLLLQQLSAADPGNTGLWRDLSVVLNKIGDQQTALNKRAEALKSYLLSLELAKVLAASDLGNVEWQRDVAVSAWKLGNLKDAGLPDQERREILGEGLRIVERLIQRNQWTAADAGVTDLFRKALAELN